jgi:hypothetical protein
MPSSATREAQYGWSTILGTITWGAPARAAVVVVPAPPWCMTAATLRNSACWLTSPTTKQSSTSSIGAELVELTVLNSRKIANVEALLDCPKLTSITFARLDVDYS